MFETLLDIQSQFDLLPRILERLTTVNQVHSKAATLAQQASEISEEQATIQANVSKLHQLGKEVSRSSNCNMSLFNLLCLVGEQPQGESRTRCSECHTLAAAHGQNNKTL
jgi:hypothetical protein